MEVTFDQVLGIVSAICGSMAVTIAAIAKVLWDKVTRDIGELKTSLAACEAKHDKAEAKHDKAHADLTALQKEYFELRGRFAQMEAFNPADLVNKIVEAIKRTA